MKFVLVFFVVVYVVLFLHPKFTVSFNGVRTNSLMCRFFGAAIFSLLLTLFIGLPLLGIILLFV